MTGGHGPAEPREASDPRREPDFRADAEMEQTPRRRRQPVLTAAALIGIILLVLALVVFGGI